MKRVGLRVMLVFIFSLHHSGPYIIHPLQINGSSLDKSTAAFVERCLVFKNAVRSRNVLFHTNMNKSVITIYYFLGYNVEIHEHKETYFTNVFVHTTIFFQ